MKQAGSKILTIAARVGYGARGVLYLVIGSLSVLAALDLGGQTVGTRGALRTVLAYPLGFILLGAVSSGFACLALWRLIQALIDPAEHGRDLKGLGIRAALGASSLVYLSTAAFAVRLMLGWAAATPVIDGYAAAAWLSSLMSAPFGPWLTGGLGLGIVAVGASKLIKAWRADLGAHLTCRAQIRTWAVPISRFGLTARGLVFVLIGVSIIAAAFRLQVDRVAGLAGVLDSLEQQPYGWMLLVTVALGLVSFGVFGIIEAVYRRVEARDVD